MTKATLVLPPDLMCDAALRSDQIENLADITEISCPDWTGYDNIGGSAAAALRDLPNRFSLAGYSMGSM